MIDRIKIYGAGSIGTHHAHAARQLGMSVTVCDIDDAALRRMKEDLYPARYGRWDESIRLVNANADSPEGFDLVVIGTPPDTHLSLALQALRERPSALLIEKPLCPPSLDFADEFFREVNASGTKVLVGYTHVVGRAMRQCDEIVRSGVLGEVLTIDVEFREHWSGIFAAHPWLSGPEDTYLGFWERGGGASGEHSHAINLWQHLASEAGAGKVAQVSSMIRYVSHGHAVYDDVCCVNVRSEHGVMGRVVQDVVTRPPRKWARVQGVDKALEWRANVDGKGDQVCLVGVEGLEETFTFTKTRPDDFIEELRHIRDYVAGEQALSPIELRRGLDTALVLAAAHLSEQQQCRVSIDDRLGYSPMALRAEIFPTL